MSDISKPIPDDQLVPWWEWKEGKRPGGAPDKPDNLAKESKPAPVREKSVRKGNRTTPGQAPADRSRSSCARWKQSGR